MKPALVLFPDIAFPLLESSFYKRGRHDSGLEGANLQTNLLDCILEHSLRPQRKIRLDPSASGQLHGKPFAGAAGSRSGQVKPWYALAEGEGQFGAGGVGDAG